MEIEILKEKEASLLERKRVTAMVTFDGGSTPSIIDFKNLVASKLKVDKELVAIRHVYQRYGFTKAKVIAHIYNNKNQLLKLEKLKKAERKEIELKKKEAEDKKIEEKKASEEKKVAVEEEKKVEEKKESEEKVAVEEKKVEEKDNGKVESKE